MQCPIVLDPHDVAWHAGKEAGDRMMRALGHDRWTCDEYNEAVREYDRLIGTLPRAIWPPKSTFTTGA